MFVFIDQVDFDVGLNHIKIRQYCYKLRFPFQNSATNVDPSYKIDLDFLQLYGG